MEVSYQRDRCEELEQHTRKQCFRITGVPLSPTENTDKKIIEIAKEIGITMNPNDIMISHRTGRNNPRQIFARIPNHNLKKRLL